MMYAYCFIPRPDIPSQRHLADRVLASLAMPELSVVSNVHPQQALPASVAARVAATHRPPLDHMDVMIIEGGREDAEQGFLLAHAIATKKPVLYLYPKGTSPALFNHVAISSLPATVVTESYHPERVEKVIEQFLHRILGTSFKEVPRIKFTLRMTDTIDQYLDFKTVNTKTTKADFLRDQIESLMKDDLPWQKQRGKK